LQKSPNKFLEPGYLPDGVLLTEISKMKAGSLNACVLHWATRVEEGQIAFRFKAVEDCHMRGVAAKKKRAPSSDDEHDKRSHRESHGTHSEDGHDSDEGSRHSVVHPVKDATGKGKAKAAGQLWYVGFTY
jgi:hypothetical protein